MSRPGPVQNILVFSASCFVVTEGVNRGDAISVMDELVLDDVYELATQSRKQRLALKVHGGGKLQIATTTEVGQPAADLHLDCCVVLMSPDGHQAEILLLVEVDDANNIADIFLLPLGHLDPETPYRIVSTDRSAVRKKFAQVACVSFTRGTQITMATGAQVPIEDLKPGDRVLTRDYGAQEIRWIGQTTLRASGEFAPIVIKAGTLNNTNDLIVSPDHRLFVYQRSDQIGAGQSELLVKARHLVNGETVYVQQGGFVDYFQLLFDHHHIIYAEGIAAESLLIDTRTRPALPPDLISKVSTLLKRNDATDGHGMDVQKALLDRPDAIDLLRRASTR